MDFNKDFLLQSNKDFVEKMKIAVIGAGYSGLCALRHFISDEKYEICVFEQSNKIGGSWNYPDGCEEIINRDPTSPLYSHMYRNLRTNLPTDLMTLEGYPFPKSDRSYCDVATVHQYLEEYAKHFNLHSKIKLGHRVNLISPVFAKNQQNFGPKWILKIENLQTSNFFEEIFDVVIVCNGKYNKPYLPELHGLSQFKGRILHSSDYRKPEEFSNQTVLIIGSGPSAVDIMTDLSPFTKEIVLSHHNPNPIFQVNLPNLLSTSDIVNYTEDSAVLSCGLTKKIDTVVLCTGFMYDFPFISEECRVEVSRGRVAPLYRHMIHCQFPSLVFILLVNMVALTPVLDCQIKFYKAVLDGKVRLPSTEEMSKETEEDFQERLKNGKSTKFHFGHGIHAKIWDYIDKMAEEAGFDTYEPVHKKMLEIAIAGHIKETATYRNFKLERINSNDCFNDRPF